MDIIGICNALSSDKRLKVINILDERDQTGIEVYKKFNLKHESKVHRETVYRDLELMHGAGIIDKRYNSSEKKLYYHLKTREITIDLISHKVSLGS